jgi:hypothetical protein
MGEEFGGSELRGARAVRGVGAGGGHPETAVFYFPAPRLFPPCGAHTTPVHPHHAETTSPAPGKKHAVFGSFPPGDRPSKTDAPHRVACSAPWHRFIFSPTLDSISPVPSVLLKPSEGLVYVMRCGAPCSPDIVW